MNDDIQRIFSTHGLRCTRQRKALYRSLCATKAHPTAEQLFQELSLNHRDISLATVYNTLEALCRVGLAQKLPGKGGSARYDADIHNHLHLRDQVTGVVADAPEQVSRLILDTIPADVLRQIEDQTGFKVQQVQMELVGQFKDHR